VPDKSVYNVEVLLDTLQLSSAMLYCYTDGTVKRQLSGSAWPFR